MRVAAVPESLVERLILLAGLAPTPIVDTFHAVIVARAIMVATRLGVFDAVASGPRTGPEMAAVLGLHPRGIEKLCNLLVAVGYLKFHGERYSASRAAAKWLRSDSPQSLHDNMLLRFLEWQAIEATEDFVRTGTSVDAHDRISGDQWETYQRGMRSIARLSAGEVASRVRLPRDARRMLDVGGGHGTYAVAFCRRHPTLEATILDLPEAVTAAAPLLAEARMGDRVAHRVGNALVADFDADRWDLVFMSHLVHHFDNAGNRDLVARVARGLRPGGVLAILDVLRPATPTGTGQTAALLDLYFAVTSNSGTWSHPEIDAWATRAGLTPGRAIHLRTAPGISVLRFEKPRGPAQKGGAR